MSGCREAPAGPAILVANEFFDALPVRQFVRTERGWRERLVGLDADGGLAFGLLPRAGAPGSPVAGRPGDVLERPEAALGLTGEIAGASARTGGGAALVIDYGHEGPAFGDTLQAVRAARLSPTRSPSRARPTSPPMSISRSSPRRRAPKARAVHGPVTQGDFLRALGIEARAAALKRRRDAGAGRGRRRARSPA